MTRAIMARYAVFMFFLVAACGPGTGTGSEHGDPNGTSSRAAGRAEVSVADTRFLADRCREQGMPADRCNCVAAEIGKQVGASMLAQMDEHLRARDGEPGARSLTPEDLLTSRAAQDRARDVCIAAHPVTTANMDEILGDYLMQECARTGAGQALCRCQWEDFRRRVKPETRLVMAHGAAGDSTEDYPLSLAQGYEIAVADRLSRGKCFF